jgi:bla regulator protein BlaR1
MPKPRIPAGFAPIAIAAVAMLRAQSPLPLHPSFDVVSIKPHLGASGSIELSVSGNRLHAVNDSALMLISYAYDLPIEQIIGATGWIGQDRYDIDARAASDAPMTQAQAREMLQAVLTERFHAMVHKDTQEMPVYALVVAKNGPKLTPSVAEARNMTMGIAGAVFTGAMQMTASKESMTQLASHFSHKNGVDRIVIDKTGLVGDYDYKLAWDIGFGTSRSDSSVPSIFEALQQQLGLKLDPQKAAVDVIVIDQLEKPSAN